MPKPGSNGQKKGQKKSEDFKYPEYKVVKHVGEDAITVEYAKELAGYTTDPEVAEKAGVFYPLFTLKNDDGSTDKVYFTNNTINRPFDISRAMQYSQSILTKSWELNGESMSVGVNGQLISAQHRLAALIIAEHRRTSKKEAKHWKKFWSGPVVMETNISYGVSEDEKVRRSVDNVKTRSLADHIYGMGMFDGFKLPGDKPLKPSDEVKLCRMLEYAGRKPFSQVRPYLTTTAQ